MLGKIYRKSKIIKEKIFSFHIEVDPDLVVPGWENYAKDVEIVLESCSKELCEIMCHFEVYDEGMICKTYK